MEYVAKLVKVIDGDSVRLDVDLGFNLRGTFDFQLQGIDAPEVVGKQAREGRTAKKAVTEWLKDAQTILVRTSGVQTGAGRWWADVLVIAEADAFSVGDRLVAEKLAARRSES